jgi:hypothetical protein
MKPKKILRTLLITIVSGCAITLPIPTLAEPKPFTCQGQRVVTVQDYNAEVDKFNECRDRLEKSTAAMEDTAKALDAVKKDIGKEKTKDFMKGVGTGAGAIAIIILIIKIVGIVLVI